VLDCGGGMLALLCKQFDLCRRRSRSHHRMLGIGMNFGLLFRFVSFHFKYPQKIMRGTDHIVFQVLNSYKDLNKLCHSTSYPCIHHGKLFQCRYNRGPVQRKTRRRRNTRFDEQKGRKGRIEDFLSARHSLCGLETNKQMNCNSY
jgi:hypothetical protein